MNFLDFSPFFEVPRPHRIRTEPHIWSLPTTQCTAATHCSGNAGLVVSNVDNTTASVTRGPAPNQEDVTPTSADVPNGQTPNGDGEKAVFFRTHTQSLRGLGRGKTSAAHESGASERPLRVWLGGIRRPSHRGVKTRSRGPAAASHALYGCTKLVKLIEFVNSLRCYCHC